MEYSGTKHKNNEGWRMKKAYDTPKESISYSGDSLTTQIGGDHYKKLAIQPIEYIHKNQIGFVEGSVIKYVSRWKNKNGVEDLKKARHLLDMLIEMEGGR
jgi:hypothetical protein